MHGTLAMNRMDLKRDEPVSIKYIQYQILLELESMCFADFQQRLTALTEMCLPLNFCKRGWIVDYVKKC